MKKIYKLSDIDCANCANEIEIHLRKKKIAKDITIDYLGKKIIIENDIIDNDLIQRIQKEIDNVEDGVIIIIDNNESNHHNHNHNHNHHHSHNHNTHFEDNHNSCDCHKSKHHNHNSENNKGKINFFTIERYILALIFFIGGFFVKNEICLFVTFLISYILISYDILWKFLKNLLKWKIFDENFLMTIATIGAFGIKEYKEAIFVMVFYKVGEFLQDKAVEKSRKSIVDLVGVKKNLVSIEDDNGILVDKDLNDVVIGDIFIVKSGETIPIDGVIVDGKSNIDMSGLTGESDLLEKSVDDEVLSGSINRGSILKIKASKTFENSAISKILDIVENSSSKKSSTEKFISRFAKIYTPIVCGIALLVFLIPTFVLHLDMYDWLYRALSFLVVSCPCALVISIPLGFFSGIGLASKNGILVKGSNYLDLINDIDTFIFDKTGTLTYGNFNVDEIKIIDGKIEKSFIYALCNTLEQNSTHPIAKSIVRVCNNGNNILEYNDYKEIDGHGVICTIENNRYGIGNSKLAKVEFDIDIEEESQTIIYVMKNNNVIAKIYISDGIKENSFKVVDYLKDNNKKVHMLTGDTKSSSKYVANKLGIEYDCNLLPLDKLNYIENLQDRKVLFVGDGLNDAPVLSMANIGIAMGDIGSDAAIEVSDVVFTNGDIGKIIDFIKIGKATKRIVIENIAFALLIKILVLILITFGISTMWMAIFADVGVSFICILNSMRLLLKKIN